MLKSSQQWLIAFSFLNHLKTESQLERFKKKAIIYSLMIALILLRGVTFVLSDQRHYPDGEL